jgi:hypothetical protein
MTIRVELTIKNAEDEMTENKMPDVLIIVDSHDCNEMIVDIMTIDKMITVNFH